MKNGQSKGENDIPLADRIFRRLLDRIYQGTLQPGSLINEVAIAQEFDVSRGPVREAVRRLQGIQLVTREPYLKARVATLSAESALELFQMRMVLEGLACKLAAQRMSEEEIAALLVELENDRQAYMCSDNDAAQAPRVFDFHERIVRASGNNRIIDSLCGDLYHLLRLYRRRSGAVPERKDVAYAEHWQIVRALKARDGDLAESLMRSHINRAAEHLFNNLPSGTDQSDRYA